MNSNQKPKPSPTWQSTVPWVGRNSGGAAEVKAEVIYNHTHTPRRVSIGEEILRQSKHPYGR